MYAWSMTSDVDLIVLQLILSENEVIDRTKKRLACPQCAETYHPDLKPPARESFCDKDGFQLVKRQGDSSEPTVIKGYRDYRHLVTGWLETLKDYVVVYEIDAKGTVKETFERIRFTLSI